MAWMASHLFVRSADQALVVEALARLLARADHRTDRGGILDAPPPALVSPAHEGWVALTGVREWLCPLPWVAAELATACGGLALSLELVGNSYALRVAEYEGGAERRVTCQPSAAAWAAEPREAETMPLYADVERLAFELLGGCGVPAPLATIGLFPLGHDRAPPLHLGDGVLLAPDEAGAVTRRASDVRVAPFAGPDAPVVPTGMSADFGLMLFDERYVEGRPGAAALDRLLQIEEEIFARAKRARPDAAVSLTVTYHGGVHEGALDEALRARGRPTAAHVERGDRVPWWQFWRHFGKLG